MLLRFFFSKCFGADCRMEKSCDGESHYHSNWRFEFSGIYRRDFWKFLVFAHSGRGDFVRTYGSLYL